ncbi:hypothetical protein V3G39_04725 [Dermatophilaceae bacterium Sec6.4]|nr:hypothetical protein [Actinomycetota bacterium]
MNQQTDQRTQDGGGPGSEAVSMPTSSSSWSIAAAAVLSAAVLAVSVYAGSVVLAGAFLLVSALLVVGWPVLFGLQRERSSILVLGIGAVALAVVVGRSGSADGIRWVTAALAISLALVFLQSLVSRGGRENVVVALAGMTMGLGVLASGAFVADAALRPGGREAVVAALSAAAAGAVIDALLLRRPTLREWGLPLSLVIGIAAGVLTARVADVAWNAPLVAGLLGAGVAHSLWTILRGLPDQAGSVRASLSMGAAGVLFAGVLPTAAVWLFEHLN